MMTKLESRLAEVWNMTQSTYITETVMMQTLQVQIEQHLETAKQQWMKLVSNFTVACKGIYTCMYYMYMYMCTCYICVEHPLADTKLHVPQ